MADNSRTPQKIIKLLGELAIIMLLLYNLTSCSSSVALNKMTFTEAGFKNPPVIYRPMPVINGYIDKGMVYGFKQLGYGGVVTNISYGNYLQDDEAWSDFEDLTEYTINKLGLHMWIYDERGYPSGSAGGLALKDNPQLQAQGIVCMTALSEKPGNLKILKPYGHNSAVAAYAFKGTSLDNIDYSTGLNLSKYLDSDGGLNWPAPEKGWLAVCIYSKNFFEGTHAAFNWAEVKRYIDILRPEPVKKFIDLTYQKYYDHAGKYFGKGVDAFFTDEPSLLGTYFVYPPPVQPAVVDKPEADIPLLTTANYDSNVAAVFKEKRGYDLNQNLPMLFSGNSTEAEKFRWDYYKTTSELVAQNYMGQLEEFCNAHKVANSGHLLFEEDIYMHPVFEGDYLQIYKNMIYPGIDLLTSHPVTALDWASTTVKMASSAAHYSNRQHVMSEVSDAFDSQKGNIEDRIGAIAVQYALGVDHINSYYPVGKMSDEENKQFTDTIGRFGYMLDGGKHIARVAVYYPIEGVWSQTTAPGNLYSFNDNVVEISNNFKEVSKQLLQGQIDYDYMDSINLTGCKIVNGRIVSPSGGKYTVFVLPQTPAIDSKAIDFLLKAADNGVKIIIQGTKKVITETGADSKIYEQKFVQLLANKNTIFCGSSYDVVSTLNNLNVRDIKLSREDSNIIYQKKQFRDGYVYMLVNTSGSEKNLDVKFNETGKDVRIWDPYTGNMMQVSATSSKDGNLEMTDLKIGAEKALFITVK